MSNLTEQINAYLLSPHIFDKRGRTAHYPSEASIISRTDGNVIGKCHRASYYSWTDVPKSNPIDARGLWTMQFGKELEEMYVEYCKKLGIWAGNNVHMYDREHNISGEADLFIFRTDDTIKVTEGMIGVEIKSAYGYGYQKSVTKFPKIENLLQCALYLDYFQMPEWQLIYKARDTMEDVEYRITMGKDEIGKYLLVDTVPVHIFYLQDIYERYRVLGDYVIKKELPPRDYTYGYDIEQSKERAEKGIIKAYKLRDIKAQRATDSDWQCLYCPYLDLCWESKRAQIKSSIKEV